MEIKGGVGSGIRGHRTIRSVVNGIPTIQRFKVLETLKQERAKREAEKNKPVEKPKDSIQRPDETNTRRGHVKPIRKEKEQIAFTANETKTNEKEASDMLKQVVFYSDGGYKEIRSGENKAAVETIETFIAKSVKWPSDQSIFRGINVDEDFLSNIKVGSDINMNGISSWTSDRKMADQFTVAGFAESGKNSAKGIGVVFKLPKTNNGVSVAHISEVPDEKEVILSGKTKLKISSVKKEKGITVVELEEYELKIFQSIVWKQKLSSIKQKTGKAISLEKKWEIDSDMITIPGQQKSLSQQEVDAFVQEVIKEVKEKLETKHRNHPAMGPKRDGGKNLLHSDSPTKAKIVGFMSKDVREHLDESMKYLSDKDVPKNCTIEVSKLGNRYGLSKGSRIYVDEASVKKEEPVFIAAIIFHEAVHSGQDYRTMDSRKREYDARSKTRMWAVRRIKEGITSDEKRALNFVVQDQSTYA